MVITPAFLTSAGNRSIAAVSGFTVAAISSKLPLAPDAWSLPAELSSLQAAVAARSSDPRLAAVMMFSLLMTLLLLGVGVVDFMTTGFGAARIDGTRQSWPP